jgi:transposase
MRTTRREFDREFKIETVRLITKGGREVSDVARDLNIQENVLHEWKQQYQEDSLHTFPERGHLKPEGEEIRNHKTELQEVKEERYILKKPWPSSRNARNEISVHSNEPLHIQGKQNVPHIQHIAERLLRMDGTNSKPEKKVDETSHLSKIGFQGQLQKGSISSTKN